MLLLVGYVWLDGGDVFINFLLIIDLGLYFLFFIFFLHYSNLFTVKLRRNFIANSLFYSLFFFIFLSTTSTSGLSQWLVLREPVFVTLGLNYSYDWYSIVGIVFNADLQFLAELYFNFNLVEFILMNFYIYLILLLTYYLVLIPDLSGIYTFIKLFF